MLPSPQVPLACLVPDTHLPAPRVLCWTFYRPGAWMGASPWLSISEPWRPCYAQGPLIEGGRQGPQAAGVSLSAVSEAGGPTWHCIDTRTPACLVWSGQGLVHFLVPRA